MAISVGVVVRPKGSGNFRWSVFVRWFLEYIRLCSNVYLWNNCCTCQGCCECFRFWFRKVVFLLEVRSTLCGVTFVMYVFVEKVPPQIVLQPMRNGLTLECHKNYWNVQRIWIFDAGNQSQKLLAERKASDISCCVLNLSASKRSMWYYRVIQSVWS